MLYVSILLWLAQFALTLFLVYVLLKELVRLEGELESKERICEALKRHLQIYEAAEESEWERQHMPSPFREPFSNPRSGMGIRKC